MNLVKLREVLPFVFVSLPFIELHHPRNNLHRFTQFCQLKLGTVFVSEFLSRLTENYCPHELFHHLTQVHQI